MPVTTSYTLPDGDPRQIINYEVHSTQCQQFVFIYAAM